jgi:hypothetical protein
VDGRYLVALNLGPHPSRGEEPASGTLELRGDEGVVIGYQPAMAG